MAKRNEMGKNLVIIPITRASAAVVSRKFADPFADPFANPLVDLLVNPFADPF